MYIIEFIGNAADEVRGLPECERARIMAHITKLRIEPEKVITKILKKPVHELIVGHYRLVYIQHGQVLYFCSCFRKKTQRTPKREIDRALALSRILLG